MKENSNRRTRFFYSDKDRIKSSEEIRKLFRNGKAFLSYPIKLILLEQEQAQFRSAVIVPKRNLRKAYQRNKVKRKLRELIRLALPDLRQNFGKQQFDFLLVYLGNTDAIKYSKLESEFGDILENIKKHYAALDTD